MKAIYIGWQEGLKDGEGFSLFNLDAPENQLHGSTVSANTLNRLKVTELFDRAGNRLLGVPKPMTASATKTYLY